MYMDPVQLQVRVLVRRSIIEAFAVFNFVQDPDWETFVLKLERPHDACIIQILDIVNKQRDVCVHDIGEAITKGTPTQAILD